MFCLLSFTFTFQTIKQKDNCNCQKNDRISSSVSRKTMAALLRKDPNKDDLLDKFWRLHLLDKDLKLLKVDAHRRWSNGGVEICPVPDKSIHKIHYREDG